MLKEAQGLVVLIALASCTPSDVEDYDLVQARRWQLGAGGGSDLLTFNAGGSSCEDTKIFLNRYAAVSLGQMASTAETPVLQGAAEVSALLDEHFCARSWKAALARNGGLLLESRAAGPYIEEALPDKYFALATRGGACSVREDLCGELGAKGSDWMFFKLEDVKNAAAREELLRIDEAMRKIETFLRQSTDGLDGAIEGSRQRRRDGEVAR